MKPLQKPKLFILLAVLVVAFATGALGEYLRPHHPAGVTVPAEALIYAFLGFAWYRLDTRQRGYQRSTALNIAVAGLASIAIPYYLFRSRGFMHGLLATAAYVLLIFPVILLQYIGAVAMYRYVQR